MAEGEHFDSTDYVGVYYKYDSKTYRGICEGCAAGGYHGNRWDAHHILPGTTLASITDQFSLDCLKLTDYDINADYSMAGMPKLTAFILYLQKDPTMPYKKSKEATVTMQRWGKVKQYASQATVPIAFPGNYPVHNPCNWGHIEYNGDVADWLELKVFNPLKKKAKPPQHPKPEDIKKQLESTKDKFWGDLVTYGKGPGGGAHVGIEDNLRHRYTTAKNGWWKPLCMSPKVTKAPSSPGLR